MNTDELLKLYKKYSPQLLSNKKSFIFPYHKNSKSYISDPTLIKTVKDTFKMMHLIVNKKLHIDELSKECIKKMDSTTKNAIDCAVVGSIGVNIDNTYELRIKLLFMLSSMISVSINNVEQIKETDVKLFRRAEEDFLIEPVNKIMSEYIDILHLYHDFTEIYKVHMNETLVPTKRSSISFFEETFIYYNAFPYIRELVFFFTMIGDTLVEDVRSILDTHGEII